MQYLQPYPGGRAPVLADNMVATSQPLATAAGLAALRAGGNAVDSALAAAITLTVVEPNSNGIGGDAFAQIWTGTELVGINASGRAPASWSLADFQARYPNRSKMPTFGWDTVTVPGAVSAWSALSKRFGRLPFSELFTDAIHYARNGFPVSPKVAAEWQSAATTYAGYPDFCAHFSPAPEVGQRFVRADQAHTLELIARSQGESFYRGELATKIVATAKAAGAGLTATDLAEHEADWVTPIQQRYRDITLHELPPNGQGITALIALGILQHLQMPAIDSPAAVHRQLEAIKIANRAATDHVADPTTMQVTTQALLDEKQLATLAAGIGEQASPLPPAPVIDNPGTVYLCTADADGMMVSYIQSNYMGFGSGIVIPETGIALQNRGHGFNLISGHPNCVGGGKRPFHTIIPGFVSRAGSPLMAFGVMGGHMQQQGHVQMVQRLIDEEQNPQSASDAPRWIVNPDYTVSVEPNFPQSVVEDLRRRGHRVSIESNIGVFGGAQLIWNTAQGYIAGSDHRKDGHAAGF